MNAIKQSLAKHGEILLNEKVNWYPGHMYRGMKQLKQNISKIDLFLEIRDSRIPVSSRNYEIDQVISLNQKKKMIVFNKFDLCNKRITKGLIE